MKLRPRSLILIVALALAAGSGIGSFAADWLPWGRSKSEPTRADTFDTNFFLAWSA